MHRGELRVIPNNDAARLSAADLNLNSDKWRAVNAAAANWGNLFVNPGTSGTVKLDWVGGHWQWAAAITDAAPGGHNAAFGSTTIASGVGTIAKLYLRALALAPDEGAAEADYNGDWFWGNNAGDDVCAFCGGDWWENNKCGVFALQFGRARSYAHRSHGGRPAYVET